MEWYIDHEETPRGEIENDAYSSSNHLLKILSKKGEKIKVAVTLHPYYIQYIVFKIKVLIHNSILLKHRLVCKRFLSMYLRRKYYKLLISCCYISQSYST